MRSSTIPAARTAAPIPPHAARCRYPHIRIQLSGNDGNAFAILGRIGRAMRDGGVPVAQQELFMDIATRSDYDTLLQTAMLWFDVA
jgi:hypothetical protein